jgi:hypothetical protein
MNSESTVLELARIANQIEADELSGEIGVSGVQAWAFVFRSLNDQEFSTLKGLDKSALVNFLMNPHEGDPLWDKYMSLYTFYEDWSSGDLCEQLADLSDRNMDDPDIWWWCFAHMPLTEADFKFLSGLSQDDLSEIALGNSPQAHGSFSRYPEIQAAHASYDLGSLETRLGEAYSLWEAHVQTHGDSWKNHP